MGSRGRAVRTHGSSSCTSPGEGVLEGHGLYSFYGTRAVGTEAAPIRPELVQLTKKIYRNARGPLHELHSYLQPFELKFASRGRHHERDPSEHSAGEGRPHLPTQTDP